jgi:hypothetical protein
MCWKCGNQQTVTPPVSRSDVCAVCGADIRSCKNCVYYAPGSHYDCHETVDEAVRDKERANFCEHFSYSTGSAKAGGSNGQDKAQKAKSDFAGLFN